MSIAANIAARQAAETVVDLINDELRGLIDTHGRDALVTFFATLRECYRDNLTVEVVKEVERAPRGPRPMTDSEASAFEARRMPWGKHKGKRIDEVPIDYLQWMLDQPDTFKVEIKQYLESEWVRKVEGDSLDAVEEKEEEELPF
jgi:uncharacterized protein (DUF3820 family)